MDSEVTELVAAFTVLWWQRPATVGRVVGTAQVIDRQHVPNGTGIHKGLRTLYQRVAQQRVVHADAQPSCVAFCDESITVFGAGR